MTDNQSIIKRLARYWLLAVLAVAVFAVVLTGLMLFAFAPWPAKVLILLVWVTVVAGLIALG